MSEHVTVDRAARNPTWDAFVATAAGGGYQQTSAWGQVKAVVGLRAVRLLAHVDGRLTGGCQVLLRDVGRLGALAYVPRGPLAAEPGAGTLERLLDALGSLAADEHVGYLTVQPAPGHDELRQELARRGYRPGGVDVAPRATTLVALTGRSDDELLAAMRSTTRRRVRQALRGDVVVRTGAAADLPILQALLEATGARQGFTAYSAEYQETMWRAFGGERGGARLLLAERDGRALSCALLLGVGETLVYKLGAWDPDAGEGRPNELIHWTAMRWGRDRGYGRYDFDGIGLPAARALRAGAALPQDASGVTFFKVGFGGDVEIYPASQDLARRTLLGQAGRHLAPQLRRAARVAPRLGGRGR